MPMPNGAIDSRQLRADFPILSQRVHGKSLVYLDNAATSQKPESVIQAVTDYYRTYNANVHRGIHDLSERATAAYEAAHEKVAGFIGAPSWREVVFVKNTTEAINLVAYAWARQRLGPGDEIVLTLMEHHSNIVPWQLMAEETGARLRWVPVTADGYLDMDALGDFLSSRTRLVTVTQASNVLGTINPVADIAAMAHEVGARVLVDGAQSVPHFPVDVTRLGCDFLAFSGHKMCGPTGSGVLWARAEILEEMAPFLGGGDMIRRVTQEGSEWNELPWKYEAGTPSIAQGIGLGAAVDYLESVGMERIASHEQQLVRRAMDRLQETFGEAVTIYGPSAGERCGVVAFNLEGIHPHDIASIIDEDGVAIRAGHHCAQPLMIDLDVAATARASFYLYNTDDEIEVLIRGLQRARKVFGL